jgi:hypothetical protein
MPIPYRGGGARILIYFYIWNGGPDRYSIPTQNLISMGKGTSFYPWVRTQVRKSTCSVCDDRWVFALSDLLSSLHQGIIISGSARSQPGRSRDSKGVHVAPGEELANGVKELHVACYSVEAS